MTDDHRATARVRRITLDAGGGIALSALLAEPAAAAAEPPRAVMVALHGGGMRAGYFDGPGRPPTSLLTLAAGLGWTVLAPDRPGYGGSADRLPDGLPLAEQAAMLRTALRRYARQHPVGAGYFIAAHSYGGKLALTTAAAADGDGLPLLGADISGLGHRWAVDPSAPGASGRQSPGLHWGPLRCYEPAAFRHAAQLAGPMPAREAAELPHWPRTFDALAPQVRLPLRLTFAEHERWWRHDEATLGDMAARLGSRTVRLDRQPGAGHNISLGRTARAYHLRLLGFLEECLATGADGAPAPVPAAAAGEAT
ncbi:MULTISPECIES: alpha/beta fold hydrolase [unclassified Streptomyces]|uniref:alpha/beta fold hydrolase n=1 Tax=unclassified Streptomyces TaxID=2593676 RepID=UPI00278BD001|nr:MULTISPECIES: alpha/beta fold hydrolase [unclassified Streptomyces]